MNENADRRLPEQGGRPLYLTEGDVWSLLEADPHYTGMVDSFEAAFKDYSRGEVITPAHERSRLVWPKDANVRPYDREMRILSAMVPGINAAGLRLGARSVVNPGYSGYTLLMEFDTLKTLAFIEDHYLHGVRSGVSAGIGVRHFATPDASTLGVLGCGRISEVQVAAATGQRKIESIKVFSRTPERREAFAAAQQEKFGIRCEAVGTAREAVSDVDIVVAATNSHNAAVLDGNWLREGTVIISVAPGELDPTTALRSRVVLTSRNRVSTDYTPQEPLASLVASGQLDLESLPLLGDVLCGTAEGRQDSKQIVLLFSPGIGFLDIAAARHVYDLAVKQAEEGAA